MNCTIPNSWKSSKSNQSWADTVGCQLSTVDCQLLQKSKMDTAKKNCSNKKLAQREVFNTEEKLLRPRQKNFFGPDKKTLRLRQKKNPANSGFSTNPQVINIISSPGWNGVLNKKKAGCLVDPRQLFEVKIPSPVNRSTVQKNKR